MTDAPTRAFDLRHLQLARAFFAAIAAIMITFSADHSAAVGLAVFSGFAIATALVFFLAVWLVFPAGSRGTAVLLGVVTLVAGMVTGIPPLRSTTLFFVAVIAWAALAGIIELVGGLRARRAGGAAERDGILIGAFTLALAVGLLIVNPAFRLDYTVGPENLSLTGTAIGVGVFGGYAAIIAVFLGIAGFSPRPASVVAPAQAPAGAPAASISGERA